MYPVLLAVACGLPTFVFVSPEKHRARGLMQILNIRTEPLIGYFVVTIEVNID